LRLSEKEFWTLTLKEFAALADRYKTEQDWRNYRAALTPSILAEIHRDHKKKSTPYTISDFMPGKKQTASQQQIMSVEEIKARFMAMAKRSKGVKHG
jgi:hypothetical protein